MQVAAKGGRTVADLSSFTTVSPLSSSWSCGQALPFSGLSWRGEVKRKGSRRSDFFSFSFYLTFCHGGRIRVQTEERIERKGRRGRLSLFLPFLPFFFHESPLPPLCFPSAYEAKWVKKGGKSGQNGAGRRISPFSLSPSPLSLSRFFFPSLALSQQMPKGGLEGTAAELTPLSFLPLFRGFFFLPLGRLRVRGGEGKLKKMVSMTSDAFFLLSLFFFH